jgi:regulator of sigma D
VVELVDKVEQVDREVEDLFVVVVEQETQEVLLFQKVIQEVLVNNQDLVEAQEHLLMVVEVVVEQLLLEQLVLQVLVELEVQEHQIQF